MLYSRSLLTVDTKDISKHFPLLFPSLPLICIISFWNCFGHNIIPEKMKPKFILVKCGNGFFLASRLSLFWWYKFTPPNLAPSPPLFPLKLRVIEFIWKAVCAISESSREICETSVDATLFHRFFLLPPEVLLSVRILSPAELLLGSGATVPDAEYLFENNKLYG